MADDRLERAQSFGQVADLYDRYRPGYPDQLYTDVLALTGGRRVLEVGAGTGRATLALAHRGATIHAVEPDPAMAAVARERTRGLPVSVEDSTLENAQAGAGGFDLVVSAQAWHWVDPHAGPAAAARLLDPAGALAVWWNRPRDLDGPVWDAIHDAYARHAPELDRRDQLHAHPAAEQAIEPAPGFTAWRSSSYDWSTRYDAESYTNMVATHSGHLRLDPATGDRLLDAVGHAIDTAGAGEIEYRYRTVLLTARPQPDQHTPGLPSD